MAKSPPSATQGQGSSLKAEKLNALFTDCMSKEQALGRINRKTLVQQVLKDYLFKYHPLFAQAFMGRYAKRIEGRYPFDFSIIRQEDPKVSEVEWRYAQILEYVKKLGEVELRLLLIARWLKQEGVCEPEEFLPKSVLHGLLSKFEKKEQIAPPKTLFYSQLVRIWLPYFECMLTDLRKLPKTNRGHKDALVGQGYDEDAVDAAFVKENPVKSPVQAALRWLAIHKDINARTAENAYSHERSRMQKGRSSLA